ncbi:LOW QUALITY PROTEIN: hypothetical protein CVT26_015249 [Gymnopilus dilepis]|uniref:Uncharacterized protein n=1 Tax=Gymnopilus dilepis TaxID=231916 RepID=A0A409W9Y2_9AGAR|nr:LOW QUALITY PROTEIN: hypothetical protein CVT26_015249 [Gymnopilus dilepis]
MSILSLVLSEEWEPFFLYLSSTSDLVNVVRTNVWESIVIITIAISHGIRVISGSVLAEERLHQFSNIPCSVVFILSRRLRVILSEAACSLFEKVAVLNPQIGAETNPKLRNSLKSYLPDTLRRGQSGWEVANGGLTLLYNCWVPFFFESPTRTLTRRDALSLRGANCD